MRLFPILAVVGLAGVSLTSGTPWGERPVAPPAQPDFSWAGSIASGKAIEIKNVNGDIRAVRARGAEVEVTATKRAGSRGDPADVRIEVLEHDDGVTICAVYPSRAGKEPNACAPGSAGRLNTHDHDTEVAFLVRVPAGVDFVGRTVNGAIAAEALPRNAYAYTVNGDVDVMSAGYAEARTVNGDVSATLGDADWPHPLEFSTVNGRIRLTLPDGVGAEVTAQTVNGAIETDFPLTVQGRFSSRRLSGVIGDGRGRLRLETVNGSIELKRGS